MDMTTLSDCDGMRRTRLTPWTHGSLPLPYTLVASIDYPEPTGSWIRRCKPSTLESSFFNIVPHSNLRSR